ncbi:MAG: hypothetical protein QM756_17460 [Polyangiaceae bacterium]
MNERDLAALQAALIDALSHGRSVTEVLARLAQSPLADGARAWLDACDIRALQTAATLVQRWSEADDSDPERRHSAN